MKMRGLRKNILAMVMSIVMAAGSFVSFNASVVNAANMGSDVQKAYDDTQSYLVTRGNSVSKDALMDMAWVIFDLARSGKIGHDDALGKGYYESVLNYMQKYVSSDERISSSKSSDNSKAIVVLTALGYDPTNVGGHNLIKGLNSMSYLSKQGINGPIWALIALDCGKYDVPANSDLSDNVTRDKLISAILAKQQSNGGWNDFDAEPDMTSMAITALLPYYSRTEVKNSIDKAVSRLSDIQRKNGGFAQKEGDASTDSSESISWVIVALSGLKINPTTDTRFKKDGNNPVSSLMRFKVSGGGFLHVITGKSATDSTANGMASEQAFYALEAYRRFLDNKTSLFDMSDVEKKDNPEGPVQVTSITLKKKVTVFKGKTLKLSPTVYPLNATNKELKWESKKKSVATVDKNGVVTGKKIGSAKIVATAKDGSGVKAECTVTVKKPIAVTKVELAIGLKVGDTVSLKQIISPKNASDTDVKWSTSSKKIAAVSNGVVTAKKKGTATITAKSANGKKDTIKVVVE